MEVTRPENPVDANRLVISNVLSRHIGQEGVGAARLANSSVDHRSALLSLRSRFPHRPVHGLSITVPEGLGVLWVQ